MNHSAVTIRSQLSHPVIDADGHWLEPIPVLLDFLRDEGGQTAVQTFNDYYADRRRWYAASPAERADLRLNRQAWWAEPSDPLDRATVMMPDLYYSRLDELGIDFAVVYPTVGLRLHNAPDPDLRRAACRALNRMSAELFAPLADRMTPAASIPMHSPDEAIEEVRYAVQELGFKVIMTSGGVMRQASSGRVGYYDTFGLDSPHDYDPFWQTCVDLGVAVSDHGGSLGWADRQSPTNYVYNHVGHFGNALAASCRALLLGGVTRRFPDLRWGFLEGGVGWACTLLSDLCGHWEKRNETAMLKHLRPTNVTRELFESLWEQHASGVLAGRFEEVWSSISSVTPFITTDELVDREQHHTDDFAAAGITSEDGLREMFSSAFYFGCEADDPMTAIAFDDRHGFDLRPMFSSDVGHWDVMSMADVLHEAWEMVEDGLVTEANFERFVCSNARSFHTASNPHFFDGTAVADDRMAGSSSQSTASGE